MTQFVVQIREKLASIENKKTGPSKKTLACQKIKLRILFSQHMTHMVSSSVVGVAVDK